jgi:hypothetical protein
MQEFAIGKMMWIRSVSVNQVRWMMFLLTTWWLNWMFAQERQERLEQWRAAEGSKIGSNSRRRKSTLADLPETVGDDRDVINIARAEDEASIKIAPSLAAVLKEHQVWS